MMRLKAKTMIPAFIAEDNKLYGPFRKDQTFSAPNRVSRILLRNKYAAKVTVKRKKRKTK